MCTPFETSNYLWREFPDIFFVFDVLSFGFSFCFLVFMISSDILVFVNETSGG